MEANPRFQEGTLRIEFTLLRKMILTLFFEHVDRQPNPDQYYQDFINIWEGDLAVDLASQLRQVDENKSKSIFHEMFYEAHGLGDTSQTAADAQRVLKEVKSHYDQYYNKK